MAKIRKSSAKVKKLVTAIVILLIAAGSFGWSYFMQTPSVETPSDGAEKQELEVYFINVGQGDCSLLLSGDSSVLIDGGESENADAVIRFLRDHGVDRLDCMICTHPHSDHAGSLPYVLDAIGADQFLMPELTAQNIPTTRTYERLMQVLSASDAEVIHPQPGETYTYGNIVLNILSPVFTEDDELNNMSIVFRVVFGSRSFLFTGDAEEPVEEALLENGALLRSDVIKVPHHGSKTSSSEAFVLAVSPRWAVVPCGDGGKNHPNEKIVERWESVGAKVLRTDWDGTITMVTDGENLSVKSERSGVDAA